VIARGPSICAVVLVALAASLAGCSDGSGGAGSAGGAGGNRGGSGGGGTGGSGGAGGVGGAGGGSSGSSGGSSGGSPDGGDAAVTDAGSDALPPGLTRLVWQMEVGPLFGEAIGGSGPNDVWVVGANREIWNSKGDGVWMRRDPGSGDRIDGVWGTGPDNVYLAPNINYILRWTNGAFVKETFGIPVGVTFHEFWGTGPNNVFVAGGGLMHTTGDGRWAAVTIPPGTNGIGNVHGFGDEVWGLGLAGLVIRGRAGGTFTAEKPDIPSSVRDIWVVGPGEVYVLCVSHLLHRRANGSWSTEAIDTSLSRGFRAIWASGPNDIYVAGNDQYLFRSNGDGRWHAEAIDPARPLLAIHHVWGTSPQNVYLLISGGVLHGRAP
jgi:hypothetical protein